MVEHRQFIVAVIDVGFLAAFTLTIAFLDARWYTTSGDRMLLPLGIPSLSSAAAEALSRFVNLSGLCASVV